MISLLSGSGMSRFKHRSPLNRSRGNYLGRTYPIGHWWDSRLIIEPNVISRRSRLPFEWRFEQHWTADLFAIAFWIALHHPNLLHHWFVHRHCPPEHRHPDWRFPPAACSDIPVWNDDGEWRRRMRSRRAIYRRFFLQQTTTTADNMMAMITKSATMIWISVENIEQRRISTFSLRFCEQYLIDASSIADPSERRTHGYGTLRTSCRPNLHGPWNVRKPLLFSSHVGQACGVRTRKWNVHPSHVPAAQLVGVCKEYWIEAFLCSVSSMLWSHRKERNVTRSAQLDCELDWLAR